MPEIKSHKKIWGTPFPIGGEWDAGYVRHSRRLDELIFVRRTEDAFVVIRREYKIGDGSVDNIVRSFPAPAPDNPASDKAEAEAKEFALEYRAQRQKAANRR